MMPNANIAQCVIQDIKFTQGLNLFYSWAINIPDLTTLTNATYSIQGVTQVRV